MKVEIGTLSPHPTRFDLKIEPGSRVLEGLPVTLNAPLESSITIVAGEDRINLSGDLKGSIDRECDRCLTPVKVGLDLKFKATFLISKPEDEASERELGPNDLESSFLETDVLYIEDVLAEQLTLEFSSTFLCSEDCRGLCQKCGANLNESDCACAVEQHDPRWEGLKDLKI